jgi:hypothetical protein
MKTPAIIILIVCFFRFSSALDLCGLQLVSQAQCHAVAQTKTKSKQKIAKKVAKKKPRITKVEIGVADAEKLGMYEIVKLYMGDMCIKEIPFFLSLHRSFYRDPRIANGDTLYLSRPTLQALKNRAISLHRINELRESAIRNIDSLLLYHGQTTRPHLSSMVPI